LASSDGTFEDRLIPLLQWFAFHIPFGMMLDGKFQLHYL